MSRGAVAGFLVALALAPAAAGAARADRDAVERLPPAHRQFLLDVDLLISKAEREEFLSLARDDQREGFITRFWEARDPYPETERNELRDEWMGRLEHVRAEWPKKGDERAVVYLLHGPPAEHRSYAECAPRLKPLEVWGYGGSSDVRVPLILYGQTSSGAFRVWRPFDGFADIFTDPVSVLEADCREARKENVAIVHGARSPVGPAEDLSIGCAVLLVARYCDRSRDSPLLTALQKTDLEMALGGFEHVLERTLSRPRARHPEWLTDFAAWSTDLPAGAAALPAALEVLFPGRRQSRTLVEGALAVPADAAGVLDLGEGPSYDFLLTGEVLAGDELHESFRYRFRVPPEDLPEGGQVPLVFQRALRPGEYRLVVLLQDLHGERFFRDERPLVVPAVEDAGTPVDAASEVLFAAAEEALSGERPLRLVGLPEGPQVGMVRFEAVAADSRIALVTFLLDGDALLAKRRPPYSVELDLGPTPRPHTLRVVGTDAAGAEVARDEVAINAGEHRFAVRFLAPEPTAPAVGDVAVLLEVAVPEGGALERVELYREETLLATLFQPPWEQKVRLDGSPGYLRAVAFLEDGNATEEVALVNLPGESERVDVQLVELYTAALDGARRPVAGLAENDFLVSEGGVRQQLLRFEEVADLPLHVVMLLDTSASMEPRLGAAREATMQFLRQIVGPRDRVSLVTFADRPRLAVELTNEVEAIPQELSGIHASRTTALYDAVVFGLYSVAGIRGQRAMLLVTDGRDESSRFAFKETLDYARASGVTIYAVGIDLPRADLLARRELTQLAEETGGRGFFVDDASGLAAIYAAIEAELRSRYLLVYRSSDESGGREFRPVEIEVARPGVEAVTIRGYYP